MSDKAKAREALKRSLLGEPEIARRAGVHPVTLRQALSHRAPQEAAGAVAKVLAEELDLSYAERREIFWELVTAPGQSVESRQRHMRTYADGDPMDALRDAARGYWKGE